jgi:hypothetical protein
VSASEQINGDNLVVINFLLSKSGEHCVHVGGVDLSVNLKGGHGFRFLLNSKPQERAIQSFEDENWSSGEDPQEYANIRWSSKEDPQEYANIQWSSAEDLEVEELNKNGKEGQCRR